MNDNDEKLLSADDVALLLKTMEKLRDDLQHLSETLEQVAFEMEEEEAHKFKQIVTETIEKITRQIRGAP